MTTEMTVDEALAHADRLTVHNQEALTDTHRAVIALAAAVRAGSPLVPIVGKGVKGSATSEAAARRTVNRVRWGSDRHTILRLLRAHPDGLTAAELADQMGAVRNQTATRLLECREAGWVDWLWGDGGVTITRPTGRVPSRLSERGGVQVITEMGVRALDNAERS